MEVRICLDAYSIEGYLLLPDINIIFTKYDAREKASIRLLTQVMNNYEQYLLRSTIRISTTYKNSILDNTDFFRKKSIAANDFDLFARELMGFQIINKNMFT